MNNLNKDIEFHQMQQPHLLALMKDNYALPEEAWALSQENKTAFKAAFQSLLERKTAWNQTFNGPSTWQKKKAKLAKNSGIALASIDTALEALAAEASLRFAEAFAFHGRINGLHLTMTDVFQTPYGRETITDIYKNHLSNEILLRLESLGFDERSAYRLLGTLIHHTIHACDMTLLNADLIDIGAASYVNPPIIGHTNHEKYGSANLAEMRNFWQVKRAEFGAEHLRAKAIQNLNPDPHLKRRLEDEAPSSAVYYPKHATKLVRRKLEYRYGLTDEKSVMDEKDTDTYLKHCDTMLATGRWQDRRTKCIESSNLTPEQQYTLDEMVLDVLKQYGDAFAVRSHVANLRSGPRLNEEDRQKFTLRETIANAYINHISNDVQEKLTAAGLRPEDAISMHGLIIKMATSAYFGTTRVPTYVLPEQDRDTRPAPPIAIQQMRYTWRHLEKEAAKLTQEERSAAINR